MGLEDELAVALGVNTELASSYLYILANGSSSPSELSEGMGLSLSAAIRVLSEMEEKGMIIRASRQDEFKAVHPRLAFSNVYRLSNSNSTLGNERRAKVDKVTQKVIKTFKLE